MMSAGFKSNSKITALHLTILVNVGYNEDISPVMPHNILKKYDWGALSFDIKVFRTNQTSKSTMRTPGQEIADEAIVYTLPSIWDKMANSSGFNQRKEIVNQFNCSNKWKKGDISRVPVIHEVTVRPTPRKISILSVGSVVVECGGVEIVQGLYTKVKQMAAYALRLFQCDDSGDILERVWVVQADSLSLVQGGFTAGSTLTESSCEAFRLCYNILVERMTPVKVRLQEQGGSVTWDILVRQVVFIILVFQLAALDV
ncbi:Aldehyde oxidase/xanthine dehydrogenase, second molybdopterin binding domain [Dillenia turbinata]|uniref:Aldehyde oxidase/xanthine dehydrogenase, second molybdopterin binding domain n=1 Tax=Dillenia turbinata TaxID=194707 RepID=A0AAN8V0U7_9MAGN